MARHKGLSPCLGRDMMSNMMTLSPMVYEDTMIGLKYLVNMKLQIIRMFNNIVVPSNTVDINQIS